MSKIWEKQWTTNDFIENSEHWSLAGDVALLNTLKLFADNLLKRGNQINNNIQNLIGELNEQSLKLSLVQNQFQRLRNSQFIESRVYEDDEESFNEEKKLEEEEVKEDQNEDLKMAIERGINVIDKYFDKVEVEISDSEDEGEFPNYILRPKDLYLDRPLPYVIGTDEWKKDYHVGLATNSESENEENEEEENSSPGSEEHFTTIEQPKKGESESIEDEDFDPPSVQLPKQLQQPLNIAEQLAAKLEGINNNNEDINYRPIQKSTAAPYIFDDEPPPLEEKKGLFSSPGGLFDDDHEDNEETTGGYYDKPSKNLFAEEKSYLPPLNKPQHQPLFNEEPPPTLEENVKIPIGGVKVLGSEILKKVQRISSSEEENDEETQKEIIKPKLNLFDDDDELFSNLPQPNKESSLFDNDDDDLFTVPSTVKSINNVSLFDDTTPSVDRGEKTAKTTAKPSAKISLFDDEPPADDLFESITKNTLQKSKLFDDINNDELFNPKKLGKLSLFDDEPPDDDLFDEVDKSNIVVVGRKPSLFIDQPPEDHESIKPVVLDKKTEMPVVEIEKKTMKKASLFDDGPPDDDFLSIKSQKPLIFGDETEDELFTRKLSNKTQITKNLSLFDDEPLEDDLFKNTEIEKNIIINTEKTNEAEEIVKKQDKFEEDKIENKMAPSAVAKLAEKLTAVPETKPKSNVLSPGKLKTDLNINVAALMPGAALPRIKSPLSEEKTEEKPENEDTEPNNKKIRIEPIGGEGGNLHHATKDRARGPLSRRPSTRRGRQAALRQSISEFSLNANEENAIKLIDDESKPNLIEDNQEIKLLQDESRPLLFGENEQKSKELLNEKTLFESNQNHDDEENSIAGQESVLFKENEATAASLLDNKFNFNFEVSKSKLFDEDDDDDKTVEKEVKNEENINENTSILFDNKSKFNEEEQENKEDKLFETPPPIKQPPEKPKNSLFDDSSDEEKADDDGNIISSLGESTKSILINEQIENLSANTDVSSSILSSTNSTITPDSLLSIKIQEISSSSTTTERMKVDKPKEKSIFDDDDDDDFFTKKVPSKIKKPIKKSLFDDSDDDLFGPSTASNSSTSASLSFKKIEKKQIKTSTIKKLENTKPAKDDPLSDLFD